DRVTVRRIQRSSRLVGRDRRRLGDDGAGDGDPLLLAATEVARKRRQLVGKPDSFQDVTRPALGTAAALAAHVKREADVFVCCEGRKQMERLEYEPDMLAANSRKPFRSSARRRMAANEHAALGRREHASENRQ